MHMHFSFLILCIHVFARILCSLHPNFKYELPHTIKYANISSVYNSVCSVHLSIYLASYAYLCVCGVKNSKRFAKTLRNYCSSMTKFIVIFTVNFNFFPINMKEKGHEIKIEDI